MWSEVQFVKLLELFNHVVCGLDHDIERHLSYCVGYGKETEPVGEADLSAGSLSF